MKDNDSGSKNDICINETLPRVVIKHPLVLSEQQNYEILNTSVQNSESNEFFAYREVLSKNPFLTEQEQQINIAQSKFVFEKLSRILSDYSSDLLFANYVLCLVPPVKYEALLDSINKPISVDNWYKIMNYHLFEAVEISNSILEKLYQLAGKPTVSFSNTGISSDVLKSISKVKCTCFRLL